MRVIQFPDGGSSSPDESWLVELDAALSGEGTGPLADSWRELRNGVRALAPPIDPAFEQQLRARLLEREQAVDSPAPRRITAVLRDPRFSRRPTIAAFAVACTLLAITLLIAPWQSSTHPILAAAPRSSSAGGAGSGVSRALNGEDKAALAAPAVGAGSAAQSSTPASGAPAPGRVQQLAASLSLTAAPEDVQAIAGRIERLASSEEGFVQSANVQVQSGNGEATLTLRLPSRRLSAALALLSQLAPVHAESQSLQDITSTYDAARQRLADATAERLALLRALAAATTAAKVEALRAQLAQVRTAIAGAQSALHAVSQRASTSELEVTVVGNAHPASTGLTLHNGLHTAGRVLLVSLVVLLTAAAVFVPLAILIAALVGARAAWRRYRRERVLARP
jgi:hypothetical protein